ncbi:MAG: hypothetical protein ACRD0D_00965 [Acidimicrobiales bacterium]
MPLRRSAAGAREDDGAARARPSGRPVTADRVAELWAQGQADTRYAVRRYWVNRAFVEGEQWLDSAYLTGTAGTLVPLRAPVGASRLTINRLRPALRTLVAKLLRRDLVFEVPPEAPDDSSVGGARVAAAVLGAARRDHDWEGMRADECWLLFKAGTAVKALDWDASAGRPLGPSPGGARVGTGDIACSVLSIAQVATHPGARDLERARWWVKGVAMPPEQAQESYGLDQEPVADAISVMSPFEGRLRTGVDGAGLPGRLVMVLTYYERPAGRSPGQVATVIGGKVVDGPHPWPFPFRDRLNLVVSRETRVEDRWWGHTVLTDAVPVQYAFNRAHSSIDEHMDKAGNARILSEEGTVDPAAWDDDPGSVVEVRAGAQARPAYMAPAAMPGWWRERPDQLRAEMDDVLGVHDVSRGDAPGGASSGIALTILAEHDDTPLGMLAKEMAESWGRYATLVLGLFAAKVTDTREARVERPGLLPEVVRWTGAHFDGQTRAVVPLDSVSPRSRAAAKQEALLLWEKGVIDDPNVFARLADLSGADDFSTDVNPQVALARRENHEMAIGLVAVPERWHNHQVHIAELNRFRTTPRYARLPPWAKGIFEDHAQSHETLAAEEMGRQVAKGAVDPALAVAAQASEPPLAGAPLPPAPAALPPPPPQGPPGGGAGGAGPPFPPAPPATLPSELVG